MYYFSQQFATACIMAHITCVVHKMDSGTTGTQYLTTICIKNSKTYHLIAVA